MRIRWTSWLVCLLTIAGVGPAPAAERGWQMATTAHYRLLSQLSERDTLAWMRDFDQFILSTSDVLKMNLRALPPLTVVIFARDKDYEPYKLLRPNGTTANVAGQFVWRPTWSMIGMAKGGFEDEARHTIYHEATHWLMSVDESRQPAWFSEGIAEMFSTFERHGSKVNWGKPIASHILVLSGSGDIPLAQFLIEPGALFDRDDRTQRFYAQAWAFTHFLMFSNVPERREMLARFLDTYKTKSGEATVQAVFGPALKDVERDFHVYIGQPRWNYMIQPVKPAADPPPLQPAPPAVVEASLGFLALGAGRTELARQHAAKAMELDGTVPEGRAILAYVAMDGGHFEEAVTHAEAALRRGSKDSAMFMLLADSYAPGGPNGGKPNAAPLRVTMYENAINLNPRRLAAYEGLTEALFALEKPRDEDAKFLSLGLKVFPGADWLRVGTAAVDYRLGKHESAMSTLESVLRPESTLDDGQRKYAAGLRASWLIDAMRSEIETAVGKHDFTAARAVLASYRERIGKETDAAAFLDQVDTRLEFGELVDQYDAALHANRKADARALATQLLARPDLPEDLRRYLQHRSGAGK